MAEKALKIGSWRANALTVVIYVVLASMSAPIISATTTTAVDSQLQKHNALQENGNAAIHGGTVMRTNGQIAIESFMGCVAAVPQVVAACVLCFGSFVFSTVYTLETLKPFKWCCEEILKAGDECSTAHYPKFGEKLYKGGEKVFGNDDDYDDD